MEVSVVVLGLSTELTPDCGSAEEAEHREPWLRLPERDGKTGQKMLHIGRSSILGDADQEKRRIFSLMPQGLAYG